MRYRKINFIKSLNDNLVFIYLPFMILIALVNNSYSSNLDSKLNSNKNSKNTPENIELCQQALNGTKTSYEYSSPAVYAGAELRKKNISVNDCRAALGLKPIIDTSTPELSNSNNAPLSANLKNTPENKKLCLQALNEKKTNYEYSSPAVYVGAELRKKNISVNDCRAALGLKPIIDTSTLELSNSNKNPQSVNSKNTPENIKLCQQALNSTKTSYEYSSPAVYAGAELRKKNVSVNDCRVALGLKPINDNLIQTSTLLPDGTDNSSQMQFFCTNALDSDRKAWDRAPKWQYFVNEVDRLGYTIDQCRSALGLKNLEANTKQSNDSPASDAAVQQMSILSICTNALNSDRKDWDGSVELQEWVNEANRREYSIDQCRIALGLTKLSTPNLASVNLSQSIQQPSADVSQPSYPSNSTTTFGRRVAIVIGNGDYKNAVRLPNPRNDAIAVSKMLESLGFKVFTVIDANKAQMEAKILEFLRELKLADVSLLYYSGHGMEIGGENFLLPVDTKLVDEAAINFELINSKIITSVMGGENKVGIILLDACRDNPFSKSLKRSMVATRSATISDGLAPLNASGGGIIVAFATAPGDVASDGEGNNSPFTTAILKWLPQKGLEIEQVLKRVKSEVSDITKNNQRPWTNSDLTKDIFLAGR